MIPDECFKYPSSHDEVTRLQIDYYFTCRKLRKWVHIIYIRRTPG